jgi:hypothetical protein
LKATESTTAARPTNICWFIRSRTWRLCAHEHALLEHPGVQRNVRIMLNANHTGLLAPECEEGLGTGLRGAQYLYREVLAANIYP